MSFLSFLKDMVNTNASMRGRYDFASPTKKKTGTPSYAGNPRYTTSVSPQQQKKNTSILLKELKSKHGMAAAAVMNLAGGAIGVKKKYVPTQVLKTIQADPKLKAAYDVAGVVGTMAQFAVPYGAASKAITSLPKITKAGEVIGKALTKTPLMEKTAMGLGNKIAGSVATDLAVGLPLNVNYAYNTQDLKGKEAAKSILTNTGLDLVTGGLMEAVPSAYRAIKGIGGAKVLPAEKVAVRGADTNAKVGTEIVPKSEVPIHKLTGEPLSNEYKSVVDRLNKNEDVSIEELKNIPEIKRAQSKTAQYGDETINIKTPERDQLREYSAQKLLERGSASHVDENGKTVYNGIVKREKRADIVIGLPASGKSSTIVDPLSEKYKSRIIDSDDAKVLLDEFDDGWGSGRVHKESKLIADKTKVAAVLNGENIVVPVIGHDESKVLTQIKTLKAEGYTVVLHLNELPKNKSLARNLLRFAEDGRYVDPTKAYQYLDKPTQIYENIKNGGHADGYTRVSNDVEKGKPGIQIDGTETLPTNLRNRGGSGSNVGDVLRGRVGTPESIKGSKEVVPKEPVTIAEHRKVNNDKNRVYRKEYKTLYENPNMPIQQSIKNQRKSAETDAKKKAYDDLVSEGGAILQSRSLKDAVNDAVDKVVKDVKTARAEFDSVTNFKQEDIALGKALMDHYEANGMWDDFVDIAERTSTEATSEAARNLNASKIMFDATPTGRANVALSVAKKLEKRYAKQLNGRTLEINGELLSKVSNANSEAELELAKQAYVDDIWLQLPGSFLEKLDAYRNMSLLLNPKTMLRNILGNLVFLPIRSAKNILALPIEQALKKMGVIDRTTQAFVNPLNAEDAKLLDFADESFEQNKDVIMASSKFNETDRPSNIPTFNTDGTVGKTMEFLKQKTTGGLELGDRIFSKPAYKQTLAKYLKANGITPETITSQQKDFAMKWAIEESQRATFRDVSTVSNKLIGWKAITPESNAAEIARAVALRGVIPFVKTPVNVVRRAFDYSPVGLLGGVARILKNSAKGDVKGVLRGIDNIASGLTGTGIMGLGYWMYTQGWLEGRIPFDAEGNFQKLQGEQGYAVKIGDSSFTIDWATPAAFPLLTGVEIAKRVEEGNFDPMSVIDALGDIATPITDLSMMSGVADLIASSRSTTTSGGVVMNTIMTPLTGYAGQFVPTASGQLARMIDPVRRSTSSTSASATGRQLEKFVNKQKAKIPGLSQTLEPYVDSWGKEQKASMYERTVQNLISPGYYSKKETTPVDKEIARLYGKTDDTGLLPKETTNNTLKFDGSDFRLTPELLTALKKTKGGNSFKDLSTLIGSKEYQAMSDEEKTSAIGKVYTEASKIGKITTLLKAGKDDWKVWTDDMGGSKSDYATVKSTGLTPKEYYYVFKDTELNGKSGTNQFEAYTKLESTNLTTEQKAVLWNKFNKAWKNNPYTGGDIPTETASTGSGGSGSGSGHSSSGTSKKSTVGLATKQVTALKSLNLDSDNGFSKAEINAIIKMLS